MSERLTQSQIIKELLEVLRRNPLQAADGSNVGEYIIGNAQNTQNYSAGGLREGSAPTYPMIMAGVVLDSARVRELLETIRASRE